MLHAGLRLIAAALVLTLTPCGCAAYRLPPPQRHQLPRQLSELGLYDDLRAGSVVADVRPYTPAFALWSDGATKRRWIRLPQGARIDSSNMDAWRFPVGTELFKEFSAGGKRIETRVLRKVNGDDDGWAAMSYAWSDTQDEASAVPDGVMDALGTTHDVPSARSCMACHGGRPERVLGFGAIQLAHEAQRAGELTLAGLVAERSLSSEPTGPIVVPGSTQEAAAIGYLHANCGHCHNAGRPQDATYFRPPPSIDLGLRVQDLAFVSSTSAYATVTQFAVDRGQVESHPIIQRMTRNSRLLRRMPPLATETVDHGGVALVSAWLRGMRASATDEEVLRSGLRR